MSFKVYFPLRFLLAEAYLPFLPAPPPPPPTPRLQIVMFLQAIILFTTISYLVHHMVYLIPKPEPVWLTTHITLSVQLWISSICASTLVEDCANYPFLNETSQYFKYWQYLPDMISLSPCSHKDFLINSWQWCIDCNFSSEILILFNIYINPSGLCWPHGIDLYIE